MMWIEVAPEPGGWTVTEFVDEGVNRVLTHRRRKRSAVLIGTGAAMLAKVELRVKNRRGEYTTEAASYGNDSPRRKG